MNFEIFARALGLSADASEAAILAAITEIRAKLQVGDVSVLALTGKPTMEEARGVILAWKSSHERVGTLTEQVAALEGASRTSKVIALVDTAIKDGKIPPAMKDFWMAEGNKSVSMLEAFVAAAPKLVSGPEGAINPKPTDPTATGIIAVSPEEQEKIFAALGVRDEAGKQAVRASVQAQNTMLAKHGVKLPTAFVQ